MPKSKAPSAPPTSYSLDAAQWHDAGVAEVPTAAEHQDVGVMCCAHADAALGLAVFEDLVISNA